jgi:hypothetical protein
MRQVASEPPTHKKLRTLLTLYNEKPGTLQRAGFIASEERTRIVGCVFINADTPVSFRDTSGGCSCAAGRG